MFNLHSIINFFLKYREQSIIIIEHFKKNIDVRDRVCYIRLAMEEVFFLCLKTQCTVVLRNT